jgi:hypothetical protein
VQVHDDVFQTLQLSLQLFYFSSEHLKQALLKNYNTAMFFVY